MRLSCYQCWSKPTVRQLAGVPYSRRHRGLGADDRSQFDIAGNLLRDANTRIKALESQLASLVRPGTQQPEILDFANGVLEARKRYSTLLEGYMFMFRAAFGQVDTTGLELGQWQVYAGVGIGIAALIPLIYGLLRYIETLETKNQALLAQSQANVSQQQNIAFAQDQLAKAEAAGDQAAIAQWTAVLKANQAYQGGAGSGGETFTQWITRNAGWVAAGAAAVFLVPRLLR